MNNCLAMKKYTPAFFTLCVCLFLTQLQTFAHHKHKDIVTGSGQQLDIMLYLLNPDSTIKAADGDVVQYDNSFSADVDIFDAGKFININETLGLLRDGVLLAIERRPIIGIRDTLFLNLTRSSKRSYRLGFTATLLNHPGLFGFLKDSYTGDSTMLDLNGTTHVDFSINNDVASQDPNRFMVVFEPINAGGVVPVTFTNIKALAQNDHVKIEWDVANQFNIKSYLVEKSIDGVTFRQEAAFVANNLFSALYNWTDNNPVTGENYYRICGIGSNGTIQYSKIIKINISSSAIPIAIFPNPAKNNVIGLRMNDLATGNYQVHIINASGQVIQSTMISHNINENIEKLVFSKRLAHGFYKIEIIKPNKDEVALSLQYQ